MKANNDHAYASVQNGKTPKNRADRRILVNTERLSQLAKPKNTYEDRDLCYSKSIIELEYEKGIPK